MGHRLVSVHKREQRAGGERAEDRLEPDLLGERDEPDQQHERAANADLRGRVLQRGEHAREAI